MIIIHRVDYSNSSLSRLRVAMGTFIAIDAEADTELRALNGIEAAFAAIAQVEFLMHPNREGSDLTAIHRSAPGVAVPVHAWTWEVLTLSRVFNRRSAGVFDPCLPGFPGRFGDLEFTSARQVIAHAPLRLDLGGIAKGYAVDRAAGALRGAGCEAGLVNAGGDLAVFGSRGRDILCSLADARILVPLRNAALATSDAGCLDPPAEHRGYYHGTRCHGADRAGVGRHCRHSGGRRERRRPRHLSGRRLR